MADKTRYHVFRELDAAGVKSYEPLAGNVEANSSAEALRATVKESGVFVAVPVRSFAPAKVTIETQTVVKVGAWLHSHKERRPHGVDERCDWCARDGRSVLISKALKPLVTYRRAPGGFLYVARNPADRARTSDESGVIATSEPDAALNPFADLSQGSNPAQEAAGE